MSNPLEESEVYQWVERHFKRMGWTVKLLQVPCCPMAIVSVQEPESKATASCPVPEGRFAEPANKMAPFIVQTIALAFGEHWKKEKAYAVGLRRAAKALGVTPDALLEALKSRTFDIEAETFFKTIGGDDDQEVGSS